MLWYLAGSCGWPFFTLSLCYILALGKPSLVLPTGASCTSKIHRTCDLVVFYVDSSLLGRILVLSQVCRLQGKVGIGLKYLPFFSLLSTPCTLLLLR